MSSAQKVTVREATFALLRAFGITTIFGNPGSTELPLFRDFPEDFRYILGLQESIVAGMADGYAQVTRNAAFVNLHASAGVGHALGNIFTAYRNYTPMIVTAGQQARSIVPFEPFLFSQQATEFPKPFVKWAIEPARAEDVPLAIARAYYVAMQRPRGPVFVSVPVDDWDRLCDPVTPRTIGAGQRGDRAVLHDIATALSKARNPALVVCAGVARDRAWDEVVKLAETYNAAVWGAPFLSRSSFPENHPQFQGYLIARRENIVKRLEPHDVVLVLGGPLSLYHTESDGPHTPANSAIYLIVDDPAVATWAPSGTAVLADVKSACADLLAASGAASVREAPPVRVRAPDLDGSVLDDRYLIQQIEKLRPPKAPIIEEAPSTRDAIWDYLRNTHVDSYFTCASGGLGHGLPAAIGVALAKPGQKVIALLGDGSSMYAIQGLWTAAQLKLPITFIIINNRRYEAMHRFGRHFGVERPVGTALPDIGFVALAKGQGVSAVRVETAADLDDALTKAFASKRTNLVEVLVQ